MGRLRHLVERHPWLVAAFALAAAATLVFAVRLTVATLVWSDPERQDQPPAAWMTPAYVARSWDVPPEVVAGALGLERGGTGRRVTLAELADARGESVESLAAALAAAIAAYRQAGGGGG